MTLGPKEFRHLATRPRDRFAPTPLEGPVGRVAEALDLQARAWFDHRRDLSTFPSSVGAGVERLLGCFPERLSARFYFDAWFVQSSAEPLRAAFPSLPGLLLPGYDRRGWGYWRVDLPDVHGNRLIAGMLLLPAGDDGPNAIDLCDYAWALHELAHPLLADRKGPVRTSCDRAVREAMRRQAGLSLADRGQIAADGATARTEKRRLWSATPDGNGAWAEEIAADQIALWLGGTIFLLASVKTVCRPGLRPHHITPRHPPYALNRTSV